MHYHKLSELMGAIEKKLIDVTRPQATIREFVEAELTPQRLVTPEQSTMNKYHEFRVRHKDYFASYPAPNSEVPLAIKEQIMPFLAWYVRVRKDLSC